MKLTQRSVKVLYDQLVYLKVGPLLYEIHCDIKYRRLHEMSKGYFSRPKREVDFILSIKIYHSNFIISAQHWMLSLKSEIEKTNPEGSKGSLYVVTINLLVSLYKHL